MRELIQQESEDAGQGVDDGYEDQSLPDIFNGEDKHELFAERLLCVRTPTGQEFHQYTDDHHLLRYMSQLWSLYANVMASVEPAVELVYVPSARANGYRLTKLGRQVLGVCSYFEARQEEGRDWQQAYAHYRFHPIIEVVFRAVMVWWEPVGAWGESERPVIVGDPDARAADGLSQLVGHIRSVCFTQAFQNRLKEHGDKANDNFRSGCDYVTWLFKHHARLLVLRIDLYFRPDAKGWGYSEEANRALKNYLRSLRAGSIVPGYLGLIIKRENGVSRGVHFHLMVFLDGHLHRSAYYQTMQMGEAWLKRVGPDKGSYFNCYARKNFYRFNGLGLVHFSDTKKLIGIRVALWYMSKQTCQLKLTNAKRKDFWRDEIGEDVDAVGAPRKDRDSMALVKRLLGGERSKYPPGFDKPKTVRVGVTAVKPGASSLQAGRACSKNKASTHWLCAPRSQRPNSV